MENCALCLINPADKTGSHIVPHFLLQKFENVGGKKGRDNELGFVISGKTNSVHFGRSVSPEKLDEVFENFSDSELNHQKHPYIVDHLLCSDCENALGRIESQYSSYIRKGITNHVFSALGKIFWLSVFWRLCITKIHGSFLTDLQQELLRHHINNYIHDKTKYCDFTENNTYYIILRSFNFPPQNGMMLSIIPFIQGKPILVVDEFAVILSFNDNFEELKAEELFGLSEVFQVAPINGNTKYEQTFPISWEKFEEVLRNLFVFQAKTRIQFYKATSLNLLHELGCPSFELAERISEEIISSVIADESKIGNRLTSDQFMKIANQILSKYISIQD